ncbi:MAG: hypothetical protein GY928_36560 [Colwellia sp.]|nr:hypothetical protein [Colwellia sp.]
MVDFAKEFQERAKRIHAMRANPMLIHGAKEYYKTRPIEFIDDWCTTYDPRNASNPDKPTLMAFKLFPRQREYVEWLQDRIDNKRGGCVEKCRDAGITEVSTAFSVWAWLFVDGFSIGWGSRKELLVDRIGDPDSIFEKLRNKIRFLPSFFLPDGFSETHNFNYMKITNPVNGNTITGEAGINIGRGGRKSMYFVDESAHMEKQEAVAAALGDNTNCEIHISSVNGMNLFYKRAKSNGGRDTFVFDWRHDPRKDQQWYDERRADAESKGLLHIFSQEVERDYMSAVQGIMIKPMWLKACIDAHKVLGFEASGITQAGVDASDEGGDIDAITIRKGSVVIHNENWNCAGDHDLSAGNAHNSALAKSVDQLVYDSIGVGAGFKTAMKQIQGVNYQVDGWNAGGGVVDPKERVYDDADGNEDKRTNADFFVNAKAQAWWDVRERARKTFISVTTSRKYDPDELLSFDSESLGHDRIEHLIGELSAPKMQYQNGKVKVESKEEMKRRELDSPNDADSLIMAFVTPNNKPSGMVFAKSKHRG